jgi:hypothetical protein
MLVEHVSVRNDRRSGDRIDWFVTADYPMWTVSVGVDYTMFQVGFDLASGGHPTSFRVACGPFYLTIARFLKG